MSLAGKLYLVTGSTDGIGLHTATRLAKAGAGVIVHGRSEARVQQAVAQVRQAGAEQGAEVQGVVADLASLEAVRQLAADVRREHGQLTCLINNAGVYMQERQTSKDGLEMTWAVNVVAPFLLTALLLDSVTDRVVNTASISAASSIDWGNLQQERGFSAHNAYSNSKLCNILFSHHLAARLAAAGSTVTSNSLDPGTVNTKMLLAGWGPIGMRIQDANDEFLVATDDSLQGVSGKYFVSGRQSRPPRVAEDPEVQLRLFQLLEQQTGTEFPLPAA